MWPNETFFYIESVPCIVLIKNTSNSLFKIIKNNNYIIIKDN